MLRTLVEAEIAREQSNVRARLRTAGFPVAKTVEEFNVGLSSVPQRITALGEQSVASTEPE